MKLIAKQLNYNAYLERVINEFEINEIEPVVGEIQVISNFDSALYFEYNEPVPNVDTKFLVWLTDANGNKNGVREMDTNEKTELLTNDAKVAKKAELHGFNHRITVEFDYLYQYYKPLYDMAKLEENPYELTRNEDNTVKDIISYWNVIPEKFKVLLQADSKFKIESCDD